MDGFAGWAVDAVYGPVLAGERDWGDGISLLLSASCRAPGERGLAGWLTDGLSARMIGEQGNRG